VKGEGVAIYVFLTKGGNYQKERNGVKKKRRKKIDPTCKEVTTSVE